MVEMWTETGQVPSEQTTQGQGDERRQQEVGDSVEVERREGHHGDGQGEREAGSHMKEFTGRDEEGVKAESPETIVTIRADLCAGGDAFSPVAEY